MHWSSILLQKRACIWEFSKIILHHLHRVTKIMTITFCKKLYAYGGYICMQHTYIRLRAHFNSHTVQSCPWRRSPRSLCRQWWPQWSPSRRQKAFPPDHANTAHTCSVKIHTCKVTMLIAIHMKWSKERTGCCIQPTVYLAEMNNKCHSLLLLKLLSLMHTTQMKLFLW